MNWRNVRRTFLPWIVLISVCMMSIYLYRSIYERVLPAEHLLLRQLVGYNGHPPLLEALNSLLPSAGLEDKGEHSGWQERLESQSSILSRTISQHLRSNTPMPDFVIGVLAWNPADSSILRIYWDPPFNFVDSALVLKSYMQIAPQRYVYASQSEDGKTGNVFVRLTPKIRVVGDVFVCNAEITRGPAPEPGADAWGPSFAIYVYYPLLGLPSYISNLLLLSVFGILLVIMGRSEWIKSQMYFRLFSWAVLAMIVLYGLMSLPGLLQLASVSWPHAGLVASLLADIIPDSPIMLLAGLTMLCAATPKRALRLFVVLLAVHFGTVGPDMVYNLSLLMRSHVIAGLNNSYDRMLAPSLYACVALLTVGYGVYRRGTTSHKNGGNARYPVQDYFILGLSLLFVSYGLLQPLDRWLGGYYQVVFAAKLAAFSGFVLFVTFDRAATRLKEEKRETSKYQGVYKMVIDDSPNPIVLFDDTGLNLLSSSSLEQQLGLPRKIATIKEILTDDAEWRFIEQLVRRHEVAEGFGLFVKRADGQPVCYVARYMPVQASPSGRIWSILVLRHLEDAIFDNFVAAVQAHSLRGTAVTALNLFNQIERILSEDYGVKELLQGKEFVYLQRNLDELNRKLEIKNDFKLYYQSLLKNRNVAHLRSIMAEVRDVVDNRKFERISVTLPEVGEEVYVRAFPQMLVDILLELLTNANKKFATDNPGDVVIGYSASEDNVVLTMRDSGTPIDPSVLRDLSSREPSLYDFKVNSRGLRWIKGALAFFGGRLTAGNAGEPCNAIPTFSLTLRRAQP